MMKTDVKILPYGDNQIVVAEYADVNSMGSNALELISFKLSKKTKT